MAKTGNIDSLVRFASSQWGAVRVGASAWREGATMKYETPDAFEQTAKAAAR